VRWKLDKTSDHVLVDDDLWSVIRPDFYTSADVNVVEFSITGLFNAPTGYACHEIL